jgi:type IV pilus assembly protein PilC
MLKSGVPILSILEVLAHQSEDGRFAEVAWDLSQSISSGRELSSAFSDFPRIFPRPLVALVAAGERSGLLVETMALAGSWLEQKRNLRSRLISAITYPTLVVIFALVGSIGICIFLLPQLLEAMTSLGGELHWTTKLLVNVSALATNPSAWLVVLATFGLLALRVSSYLETESGKLTFGRVVRSLPLVGTLYRALGLTQFLATLGAMLRVGMDMVRALTLSLQSSGDAVLARTGKQLIEAIMNGEKLGDSMAMHPDVFPPTVVGLVFVGEESGQLANVLPIICKMYDENAKSLIEALVIALEPLLLGCMAVVVAFCAVGFLMPLQGLLASLG